MEIHVHKQIGEYAAFTERIWWNILSIMLYEVKKVFTRSGRNNNQYLVQLPLSLSNLQH